MPDFLSLPAPFVMAHRGGPEGVGENTDAAFARSIGLGVRCMESDIRTTADGVPVLFHDENLLRVADVAARMQDLDWSSVAKIRLAGDSRLLRLDEALMFWPGIRWNLDVKDDRSVEPTVAALTRAHAGDRVCVTSFSHKRLLRLREALGPGIATGATWRESLSLLRLPGGSARLRRRASPSSPAAIQVPPGWRGLRLLTSRSVEAAHRAGLQVHAWVINDPEEMARLLRIGVDGIVTDHPKAALDLLRPNS